MTDHTPCPACSTPAAPVSHTPTRVQRHTAALAAAAAHVAAGGALLGQACERMATPNPHTYQTVNNNDDCAVCDTVMLSTDQLGTVFVRGERLLAHWDCRTALLAGNVRRGG